jgi:energy-coupling factor transporter ATP-binding protein EcfA2
MIEVPKLLGSILSATNPPTRAVVVSNPSFRVHVGKNLGMSVRVRLTSLVSSGGETVTLPLTGVTCLVGGNNVGKSQLLREIAGLLSESSAQTKVLSGVTIDKPIVSIDEAKSYLTSNSVEILPNSASAPMYQSIHGGPALTVDAFLAHYHHSKEPGIGQASSFFRWHASAGSLLDQASGTVARGMGPPTHPLMRVFRDGHLEAQLSDVCGRAFGHALTIDRINADTRLRVGTVEDRLIPRFDHPTVEYADAILALPTLEDQGDGIKSFIGLCVTIIAGTSQILLIDEPEAFLHPAQARRLGRFVRDAAAERDRQVIVATHDRDFLLGLLEGSGGDVNVVRISRHADVNHFRHLAANDISSIWADPVLRYSNLLQGLFHRAVVICEGDSDCRFYGAILDQLGAEQAKQARTDDVLFVPSGGKSKAATMATAMSRAGVEAHVIVDFDIFKSKAETRALALSTGFEWSNTMEADYLTFSNAANGEKLWSHLKKQGLVAAPNGAPHAAGESLLSALADRRIHVVPVGEMEGFNRSSRMKSGAWVTEMLSNEAHQKCNAARAFVSVLL